MLRKGNGGGLNITHGSGILHLPKVGEAELKESLQSNHVSIAGNQKRELTGTI